MHYLFLLLFSLFSCHVVFTQSMRGEDIDTTKLSTWQVNDIEQYEGTYYFGFSEGEFQVTIAIDGDLFCIQLRSYDWATKDDGQVGWKAVYTNFTNIRITDHLFFSDQYDGRFVFYKENSKSIKCLQLFYDSEKTNRNLNSEIGIKSIEETSSLKRGAYPMTSFRLFSEEELMKYTLDDLQIMRNEIFARYGYIFRAGGKMDAYFSLQKWYHKQFTNVDSFITALEKENIKRIQTVEKAKKEN